MMPEETRPQNVRKCLQQIRKMWGEHKPAHPFCIVGEVEPGLTVAQFCTHMLLLGRGFKRRD